MPSDRPAPRARISRSATTLLAAAAAASLILLAGCGGDPDPAASPSPAASAASASPAPSKPSVAVSSSLDAIKVTGADGKKPKVTFKAPFAIDKTRTEVVSGGDGPRIAEGATVTLDYLGINGRTGKAFDDSYDGDPVTFNLAQTVPGFSKGLVGQRQGSRVLIAMPGSDGYDASGGNQQIGVEVGDTLLFVVDIVAAPLEGPEGKKVDPKPGLPTVTDKGGVPEVTMPKSDPPAKLTVQPLIKGAGAEVGPSDTITFDYRWYTWDGKLLEDSYASGPQQYPVSGLVPGLAKGLTGQTVGSRVMVIVPPADGYPNGNATPKVDPDTTLVFVVDLLFASPTQ